MKTQHIFPGILTFTAVFALAACSGATEGEDTETKEMSEPATSDTTAPDGPAGGVVRNEVQTEEPAPAPMLAALMTQPGPDGTMVSLQKAKVTGDVLSVQLGFTKTNGSVYVNLDDTSVIDDATAQRLAVLKDNTDSYMASPKTGNKGDRLYISFRSGDSIAWFKFPAPAATTETVSINIDGVGTFDGIKVQR